MQFIRHQPVLIISLSLITLSIAQLSAEQTVVLLQNQSSKIDLFQYISGPNTSFSLPNGAPDYASLNFFSFDPLANIIGTPENIASGAINTGSGYVAFIDNSLMLYYGPYLSNTTNNLTSINIPANGSTCTSIISYLTYFIIVCGYINPSGQQVQNVYNFYTSNNSFSEPVNVTLPYNSLQNLLIPQITDATIYNTITYNFGLYYDFKTLGDLDPVICLFDIYNYSFCIDYRTDSPISVQKVQISIINTIIFDVYGGIFAYHYNTNPATAFFRGNITDTVLQICRYHYDYLFGAFSKTKVYFFSSSTLQVSYDIPEGFNPLFCSIDYSMEFMLLIAQNENDNSTHNFVYLLDNNPANGGFLTDLTLPTVSGDILAVSSSQIPGQIVLLYPNNVLTVTVSKPSLVLLNVQESSVFNVSVENPQNIIPINVELVSDTQIYQKQSDPTPIASFNPAFYIKDFFVGPVMEFIIDYNTFFGGFYGACSISKFSALINQNVSNFLFSRIGTSTNQSVTATFIYSNGSNMQYIDINFNNPYLKDDWSSSNSCNSDIQVVGNQSVGYSHTNCVFGQIPSDYCLIGENLIELQSFLSDECDPNSILAKLTGNYFACILPTSILVSDISVVSFGPYDTLDASDVDVESFYPFLTSSYQYSSLLLFVVSYPQGLIGVQVTSMPNFYVFKIEVNYSNNSFVQIAGDRLVLADFDANEIKEWDISDLYNPFLVGNYPLFSFKLDPTFTPTYYSTPNHLIFSAFNGSEQYILVFQPGNEATSVLLYAINIANLFPGSNEVNSAGNLQITSFYDPLNEYTWLVVMNQDNLAYFYAQSSPFWFLTGATQDEGGSTCLYCSGNAIFNIFSNIAQGPALNISISYVSISSQQPIVTQNSFLSISNQSPLYLIPSDLFDGTIFNYSLSNLTIYNQSALLMETPLNLSQSLSTSIFNTKYPIAQITIFSDSMNLYVLYEQSSWFINLNTTSLQLQQIALSNLNPLFGLLTGASSAISNTSLFALYNDSQQNISYGLYNPNNQLYLTIEDQILKIQMVNTFAFVLTQPSMRLLYVLNVTESSLDYITTVNKAFSPFSPVDFSVVNLNEDLYAILIVDGTDTLRSIILNITSGDVVLQVFSNYTQIVQTDFPQEPLQIAAVQSVNTTVSGQTFTVDYVFYVNNFHSYQVQIIYNQQAQLGNVSRCFVQIPEHTSTGNGKTTDYYFLDIKQNGGLYYLYSYPLNLTYNSSGELPGNYSYIKPIQRQLLNSPTSLSLDALNGENGVAFVATNTVTDVSLIDTGTANIQVNAYSLSSSLKIAFNKSLNLSDLQVFNLTQLNLRATNDISNNNASILIILPSLPPPTPEGPGSGDFVGLFIVLGVVLFALCILMLYKFCTRRKVKLVPNENYQRMMEPAELKH